MHANAPLTPTGRRILCERIGKGRPIAHVAAEMGVSRQTASKWRNRYLAEGEAGPVDRRMLVTGRLPQENEPPRLWLNTPLGGGKSHPLPD